VKRSIRSNKKSASSQPTSQQHPTDHHARRKTFPKPTCHNLLWLQNARIVLQEQKCPWSSLSVTCKLKAILEKSTTCQYSRCFVLPVAHQGVVCTKWATRLDPFPSVFSTRSSVLILPATSPLQRSGKHKWYGYKKLNSKTVGISGCY
jgi:hypothetical protein